jgi:hypothetical protein
MKSMKSTKSTSSTKVLKKTQPEGFDLGSSNRKVRKAYGSGSR